MTEIKREREIKIRVFESEYQQLLENCPKPRLAEWMREYCLGEKPKRVSSPAKIDPMLLRQLAGIGNNINQLTKAIHHQDWKPIDRVTALAYLIGIERELLALRRNFSNDR
ncbi:MobC family plasmid mobilization relaxosome protein [Photobacterium damselae]|uniref:MobC family plasmid mobilization relaxosome protein n=1 Tax=Photobacterium damselae TaxID=38293 RepID=UPI004067AF63